MGCLCHYFGWEDRHGCFGLPSGNPPPPAPDTWSLLPWQSGEVWAGVGMAGPTQAILLL